MQTLLPYLSHGKNDHGHCQQRGQEASSSGAEMHSVVLGEEGMSSAVPPGSRFVTRSCQTQTAHRVQSWALLPLSVSFPRLCWVPLGAAGHDQSFAPREGWGELAWSTTLSSGAIAARVASQGGCSLPFTLTPEINSCISETWVCGERCCTCSATFSGDQKDSRFLLCKNIPFESVSPLVLAGATCTETACHCTLSCVPLSAGNVVCQKQRLTSPSIQEASR